MGNQFSGRDLVHPGRRGTAGIREGGVCYPSCFMVWMVPTESPFHGKHASISRLIFIGMLPVPDNRQGTWQTCPTAPSRDVVMMLDAPLCLCQYTLMNS